MFLHCTFEALRLHLLHCTATPLTSRSRPAAHGDSARAPPDAARRRARFLLLSFFEVRFTERSFAEPSHARIEVH